MALNVLLSLLTASTGGFMLVDGARNLLTGTYFGPALDPGASPFEPQASNPNTSAPSLSCWDWRGSPPWSGSSGARPGPYQPPSAWE